MTYTFDSIPDLTGTVTVVTGANAGLGFATIRALAAKGSHVVMAARNHDKATPAAEQIRATTPHLKGTYSPSKGYGQSKLANHHFALGLQRQFEKAGVGATSLLAHPGLSNIDLQSNTVQHGGELCAPRYVNNGPAVRRPILRPGADEAITMLWLVSERETGIPMVV